MTGRRPQTAFRVGPVNVDKPPMGVRVCLFSALQPEDPGLDMVGGVALAAESACGLAADKDFPRRGTLAPFGFDPESPRGSFVAAGGESGAELGGGNDKTAQQAALVVEEVHGLGGDVNAYLHRS